MTKEKKNRKEMTTGYAAFGFFAPIVLLVALIFIGADMTIAIVASVFLLIAFGIYMGFSWEDMEKALTKGVAQVGISAAIMLLVGCMVAVWMASGCIPSLLYYGLHIINPTWFLPICFILPAFMSVCAGTSWGSISTIGVVLCGMAASLGINVGVAAGAVISGSFFGDKMSPLSDTTLLAAASNEVSVFDHITSMWYTTVPATIICLVLYTILGINASGTIDSVMVGEMNSGLSRNFNIGIWNLIPVILVLILSVKKVPAFITFGIGILVGVIWAMIFQGYTFADNLSFMMNGFSIETGVTSVDTLVNRGGFSSMLSLVGIMIFCGMLSGLLEDLDVAPCLVNAITKKVHTPFGIMCGAMASCVILVIAGGQYTAITITSVAFKEAFDKMDIHPCVLSRTVEDVGTLLAAIIPWNAWVIGYGVVLGTTTAAFIPFTFLPIISPFIALLNSFFGIGLWRKSDEVKYRPFWRRKSA